MTQWSWLRLSVLVATLAIAAAALPLTITAQDVRGVGSAQSTTVKATIVAIDKATRMVTLRGPKGNDFDVHADENVQRFNDLKVGDVITATYTEKLAIKVRKPGVKDPESAQQSITRQPNDLAATVTQEQTATVTVQEIDMTKPSLTVKGPKGNSMTFKVRDKENLRNVKVGDKVDVTYTESVLMRADRPQ